MGAARASRFPFHALAVSPALGRASSTISSGSARESPSLSPRSLQKHLRKRCREFRTKRTIRRLVSRRLPLMCCLAGSAMLAAARGTSSISCASGRLSWESSCMASISSSKQTRRGDTHRSVSWRRPSRRCPFRTAISTRSSAHTFSSTYSTFAVPSRSCGAICASGSCHRAARARVPIYLQPALALLSISAQLPAHILPVPPIAHDRVIGRDLLYVEPRE